MIDSKNILASIKNCVSKFEPDSVLILYGSYARGDNRQNSDIDLLILLNQNEISINDKKRIKYPLYEIEFDTGIIISPLIFSKNEWETKHKITPFYENIRREGIVL